jgi:hypothetical protein
MALQTDCWRQLTFVLNLLGEQHRLAGEALDSAWFVFEENFSFR